MSLSQEKKKGKKPAYVIVLFYLDWLSPFYVGWATRKYFMSIKLGLSWLYISSTICACIHVYGNA